MDYLESFVALTGHLAWPLTAAKEGLIIKTQQGAIASLQAEQDQVKSLLIRNFTANKSDGPTLQRSDPAPDPYARLCELASAYLTIDITDYRERTLAKNAAAADMALHVVANKIDKDRLANEHSEGLVIALAESIILTAEPGDAERLLRSAQFAQRPHVRFRVLMAFVKLFERALLPPAALDPLKDILSKYEQGADQPLAKLIAIVHSFISLNEGAHGIPMQRS